MCLRKPGQAYSLCPSWLPLLCLWMIANLRKGECCFNSLYLKGDLCRGVLSWFVGLLGRVVEGWSSRNLHPPRWWLYCQQWQLYCHIQEVPTEAVSSMVKLCTERSTAIWIAGLSQYLCLAVHCTEWKELLIKKRLWSFSTVLLSLRKIFDKQCFSSGSK